MTHTILHVSANIRTKKIGEELGRHVACKEDGPFQSRYLKGRDSLADRSDTGDDYINIHLIEV
jgi:hypothetical protein